MVNSLSSGWGCGIIRAGVGFSLQNRGSGFTLQEGHPNVLAGGKLPYHTIIPGMMTKGGELYASFTNMGGYVQPPAHVQLVSNMVDYGMDPQSAIDAPRFSILAGPAGVDPVNGPLSLEVHTPIAVVDGLKALGHDSAPRSVQVDKYGLQTGKAQIILREPATGVLCAGSDGRGDGMAIGW
jgi:gamma-glutamyltranspeptidase/glutathione hydrolase